MKGAVAIAILAGVLLSVANLLLGSLNQDEGWYLLAGMNTASGLLPYRDYFFSQGPVLPYVYAAMSPVWTPFGLLGGRVLTALLGLTAAGCCAGLAYRIAPSPHGRVAALLAWLMTALCPVYSYFTAIPKTYALSGVFVAGAFFLLAGRGKWRFEACGVLLALAAGTRLSLGLLLAVVGVGLLVVRRREDFRLAWLRFGLAGGILLTVIFLPFLLITPEGLFFSHHVHAGRAHPGLLQWVMLRAGFFSRLLQGYFLLLVAVVIAAVAGFRGTTKWPPVAWMAAAGFFAVTLAHAGVPFPYDDYQTPIMPIGAALAGVLLSHVVGGLPASRRTACVRGAVLAALCFAAASPLCMDWVVVRQDRFWFEMKDEPDVFKLRRVARMLTDMTEDQIPLFTQDAYLAVEARRRVVPGLEMGPFSLFPGLDDETARQFCVHNVATLERAIAETDAEWAALSGYAFAVSCPSTEPLDEVSAERLHAAIDRRFVHVADVPNFGQGHTVLSLFRRRDRVDPPPAPSVP